MEGIAEFAQNHIFFTAVMAFLSAVVSWEIAGRLAFMANRHLFEAAGGRNEAKSLYKKALDACRKAAKSFERNKEKPNLYVKVKNKLKKSGLRGEYAVLIYLFFNYCVPVLLFTGAFIVNFPDFIRALVPAAALPLWIQIGLIRRKKYLELRLQRSIYKIYKYLHNQISSGIKATDAIKTMYEVIDDREIKEILVLFAARFELTLDCGSSLEELKSNFDLQEVETLCVALQQGIDTGGNREMLARQEELMFSKYFSYIQAETDSCRLRGMLAAGFFTVVVVLMIGIPMFHDVLKAVDNIFGAY